MNQTTNFTQFKNLTDGKKAEFDFENYSYELQARGSTEWTNIAGDSANPIGIGGDDVYRLVIEKDRWYWCALDYTNVAGVRLGKDIKTGFDTLRPCTPSEIPKPEPTLEERIKEKWPNHSVVVLGYDEPDIDGVSLLCVLHNRSTVSHVLAQSMRGFYEYVYLVGDRLYSFKLPTDKDQDNTIQPVAVLFAEAKK